MCTSCLRYAPEDCAATWTLSPPGLPDLAINSISNSISYISSGPRTGATVRKLQIGIVEVFGEYGRGDFRQTDNSNPEMRRTSLKHSCYIVESQGRHGCCISRPYNSYEKEMYLLCWADAGHMYSIWPRYVSGAVGARGGKDASHPISDLASPLKGGEATSRFGDLLNLIIIMVLLI